MELKIVSLNIWHGGRLFEPMIDFLRSQDADILMLQEVFNDHNPALHPRFRAFTEIPKRLGYVHAHFAPAMTFIQPEGDIVEGNAVFSKFPLVGYDPVFFNEPYRHDYIDTPENFPVAPRILQRVEVQAPVGTVNVFNLQGVWDLDGDNYSERRKNMSRIIIEQIKGLPRVVLAGDTNAKPTNKAMLEIEKHLDSVFKNDLTTSFNVRRKDLVKFPGYATATVDLMYVSHDIQVLERDCPDVDISDHLPLTVTLKIS